MRCSAPVADSSDPSSTPKPMINPTSPIRSPKPSVTAFAVCSNPRPVDSPRYSEPRTSTITGFSRAATISTTIPATAMPVCSRTGDIRSFSVFLVVEGRLRVEGAAGPPVS